MKFAATVRLDRALMLCGENNPEIRLLIRGEFGGPRGHSFSMPIRNSNRLARSARRIPGGLALGAILVCVLSVWILPHQGRDRSEIQPDSRPGGLLEENQETLVAWLRDHPDSLGVPLQVAQQLTSQRIAGSRSVVAGHNVEVADLIGTRWIEAPICTATNPPP